MEKITLAVPSTNLLKNYGATVQQKRETFTAEKEPAKEIISKEAADASRAYSGVAVKQPFEKKSFDDKKAELLSNGKVEGENFKIYNAGKNLRVLEVLNDGKPSEIYYYNDSGNPDGFTKYQYCLNSETTGLKYSAAAYDGNGVFKSRTNIYEKDKSPYTGIDVNFETEAEDLIEHLKSENIRFAVDKFVDGELTTDVITAFDAGKVYKYEFVRDINGNPVEMRKIETDENGKDLRYITFSPDETSYTEYKESFVA